MSRARLERREIYKTINRGEPVSLERIRRDIGILLGDEPSEETKDEITSANDIEPITEETPKPKRTMNEAQKAALLRGQQRSRELGEKKRAEAAAKKERLEKEVVKKALSVKRKEMKEKLLLDVISDDDDEEMPLEKVKQAVRETKSKKGLTPDEKVKEVVAAISKKKPAADPPVEAATPQAAQPPIEPVKPKFSFF